METVQLYFFQRTYPFTTRALEIVWPFYWWRLVRLRGCWILNCGSGRSEIESKCCSVTSDFLQSHGLYSARLLCPWNSPGKSTGVGSHSHLQGIFLTQGLNPGLSRCRQSLYHLGHQTSPQWNNLPLSQSLGKGWGRGLVWTLLGVLVRFLKGLKQCPGCCDPTHLPYFN